MKVLKGPIGGVEVEDGVQRELWVQRAHYEEKLKKTITAAKNLKTIASNWENRATLQSRRIFFLEKKLRLVQEHASAAQANGNSEVIEQQNLIRKQSIQLRNYESKLKTHRKSFLSAQNIMNEKNTQIVQLEKLVESLGRSQEGRSQDESLTE